MKSLIHIKLTNKLSPCKITIRGFCSQWARVYRPTNIEPKWQKKWAEKESLKQQSQNEKPNFYALSMFPYPSGNLHMGHVRVYTICDTIARLKSMEGYNVFQPMGWDAFGLPAENAAIERGLNPAQWTLSNISNMKQQLIKMGTSFHWENEITTCKPEYYKWTQFLFLQLYEKGLAYQKQALVNWDPVDKTVLANEQVDANGKSWRSGALVEQRLMTQWFFKITHYTKSLLEDLDKLSGWPDVVKNLQRSWIGKSTGAFFDFKLEKGNHSIRVFTTRPDTVYGVTFLSIGADSETLYKILDTNKIQDFKKLIKSNDSSKEMNGYHTGIFAIHPFTKNKIPIYVADYVLSDYGTGAVMGVPAHDTRDYEFAKKHSIPIKYVVIPTQNSPNESSSNFQNFKLKKNEEAFVEHGTLVDSEQFTGLDSTTAQEKIIEYAKNNKFGGEHVDYKLRDWLISRQRYWGAPIPLIHCSNCKIVPVPKEQLPVVLPENVKFTGKGTVLAQAEDWVKTTCPKCGGLAHRETDTMDTFVDSSWYFLRYPDSHNEKMIFNPKITNAWMPVNLYVGGIEHAILHLLYSRFINKFLHDQGAFIEIVDSIGLVKAIEPFQNLLTQGMVQGRAFKHPDTGKYLKADEVDDSDADIPKELITGKPVTIHWEKMSKSKYNGVDPEPMIEQFGADTVRLFMLFKAPPENDLEWEVRGIQGLFRWLGRLWTMVGNFIRENKNKTNIIQDSASKEEKTLLVTLHQTIKHVSESFDLKNHTFNVGIAELMKLSNVLGECSDQCKKSLIYYQALRSMTIMMAPMAPHVASEFWEGLVSCGPAINNEWAGRSDISDVLQQTWPKYDPSLLTAQEKTVVISVNGKKRALIQVPADLDEATLEQKARENPQIQKYLAAVQVKKVITGPKVINFVVS